jgi:cell division transport system permease protein
VPIGLAGVSWSVMAWLEPVIGLAREAAVVPVLLHPQMDEAQRREWLEDQGSSHPGWQLQEVPPAELAERLSRWFPYLEDLLENSGEDMLSPLVEITLEDPGELVVLEDSPAVIAIGPRSSMHRLAGRAARSLARVLGATSVAMLVAAALFAAVWVHLELFRHGDELTIMRLVGATEPAVRGPFLVAIAFPGLLAAAGAVAGTVAATAALSRLVGGLGLPGVEASSWVLVMEVLTACVLPVIVALKTLARHAATDFDAVG